MAQLRILAVAAAALTLAGCAKGACDKVADAYYDYRTKALGCAGVAPSFKIGDACSVYAGFCDGDDTKVLEAYATCIGGIAKCEAGGEDAFLASEASCLEKVLPTGISNSCGAALTGVCEYLTDANKYFLGGMATCSSLSLAASVKDSAKCMDASKDCSATDRDALTAYGDCVTAMDACVPEAEADFTAAEAACLETLKGALSGACSSAILAAK